jgi:hypothetical protein
MVGESALQQPDSHVNASMAVEEILDQLAADVGTLGPAELSPLVIERLDVSDTLDAGYAALLETRLIAALYRKGVVQVVRCLECRATRMNVEDGHWIVRQGLSRREDLEMLTKKYGAKATLRGVLTLHRNPDSLALDVEITRTNTAAVLFAESYRFDASTALLYRGADAEKSREERRADLQDRLDGRPHFGQALAVGAMLVPEEGDSPIIGAFGSYRLYEAFGEWRQHRVGLNLGAFMHSSRLAGAVVQVSMYTRLNSFSLYGSQLFLGGGAGGFLTGGGGNTPMGTGSVELLLGERMTIQASVSWVHPFEFADKHKVGGVVPQGGVGFLW